MVGGEAGDEVTVGLGEVCGVWCAVCGAWLVVAVGGIKTVPGVQHAGHCRCDFVVFFVNSRGKVTST